MGTAKREARFFDALTVAACVFAAVIVCAAAYLYWVRAQTDILQEGNSALGEQIAELNEAHRMFLAEIESQEEEIILYKTLDERLLEVKADYFKNAKTLETMVLERKIDLKIAYLTFDDGPYILTTDFLDTLDRYDVLGTFFCLGKPAEMYDATYRRIVASGHTIGNHTYSHNGKPGGIYSSVDAFIKDVIKNRTFIEEKLHLTTNILRFPMGSPAAGNLKDEIVVKLRELGYGYINWNVSCGDGGGPIKSVQETVDNVINGSKGYRVICVLMHDYSKNTSLALPAIIEGLQEDGFVFLPLFYESDMIKK